MSVTDNMTNRQTDGQSRQ